MSARAYVEVDLLRRGVKIHLADNMGDGMHVAQFDDVIMKRVEDPAAVQPDPRPLVLPDDSARALYEALARHFGGAPDMATLRRDYDAERARVDRFISHLTGGTL